MAATNFYSINRGIPPESSGADRMKTTKEERAFYSPKHKSCCDDCGAPICEGCSMPWPCLVRRLIADVEEATRLLAGTQCHSFNPAPLKLRCEKADCETCDFLKEPSDD